MVSLADNWCSLKSQYQDFLIIFQIGDFYELFSEDAEEGERLLSLKLTKREKQGKLSLMCGFPLRSLETNLSKLLLLGARVVVCKQRKDPEATEENAWIRYPSSIHTPSTSEYYPLRKGESQRLLSIYQKDSLLYPCLYENIDLTLQRLGTFEQAELEHLVSRLRPQEIISNQPLQGSFSSHLSSLKTPDSLLPIEKSMEKSAMLLLNHLHHVHLGELPPLDFQKISQNTLFLSPKTETSLHLSSLKGSSLFSKLDQTKTPMGARLLHSRILAPFVLEKEIEKRLSALDSLIQKKSLQKKLEDFLFGMGDVKRSVAQLKIKRKPSKTSLMKPLSHLFSALQKTKKLLEDPLEELQKQTQGDLEGIKNTFLFFEENFTWNQEGSMIWNTKTHPVLQKKKSAIEKIEKTIQKELLYFENKNPKLKSEKTLSCWLIKAEDFPSLEKGLFLTLKKRRGMLHLSHEKLLALLIQKDERKEDFDEASQLLLASFLLKLTNFEEAISRWVDAICELDVLLSLAQVAIQFSWIRPQIGSQTHILKGLHPLLKKDSVPNDIQLDSDGVLLIQGANMGGKSTFMRQVALSFILAQIGSFLPAKSATIQPIDAIFSRMQTQDDFNEGHSTFSLELKELKEALSQSTTQSLILLDELAQGTNALEGEALAYSILLYFLKHKNTKLLLSSHHVGLSKITHKRLQKLHAGLKREGAHILPTYQIKEGKPDFQAFHAISLAERMGISEFITTEAKRYIHQAKYSQEEVKKIK